jgi:hypothetical protein
MSIDDHLYGILAAGQPQGAAADILDRRRLLRREA